MSTDGRCETVRYYASTLSSVQRYKARDNRIALYDESQRHKVLLVAPMWLSNIPSAGVHNEVKDPHIERRFRAE